MRVFLVLYGSTLGGGGGTERRFMRAVGKVVSLQEVDVELLINKELLSSALELGLVDNHTKVRVHAKTKGGFLTFSIFVISCILKCRPNVIHLPLIQVSLIPVYLFLLLFKKLLGIRVVSTVASYRHAYRIRLSVIEKITYNLLLKCSDTIDSLYSNIVLDSNREVWITPCSFTDYDRFSASKAKQDIIVFSGRLVSYKNPMMFLEAINELVNVRRVTVATKWKYYIFGDGPLRSTLESYVQKQGLGKLVTLSSGDTSSILCISKIFVSLQQYENYPSQSLLEAIAAENVVVATDVGDTRKIVNDRLSVLIDPDVCQLANALENLMRDNDNLLARAEEALARTMRQHDIDRFVKYLVNLWHNREPQTVC